MRQALDGVSFKLQLAQCWCVHVETNRSLFVETGSNDDHNPAARGHTGRRDEPKQRRTIVDPSLRHGLHPRQATMIAMSAKFPYVMLCFIPPHSTSHLQPCDVAVFRSFKSCIGRMGSSCSHGPLRHEPGVDDWLASLAQRTVSLNAVVADKWNTGTSNSCGYTHGSERKAVRTTRVRTDENILSK